MVTDSRTANRNYPRPSADNTVAEDFTRLIDAMNAIDTDVAGLLTSVSQRALLSHTHTIANVTGLQAALDGKAAASHTHALAALTDVNVTGAANGQFLRLINGAWSPSSPVVTVENIDGSTSTGRAVLAGDAAAGRAALSAAAAAHSHAISDVTGLQPALDGKAATSHTHTIANVTGLQAALDGKAPIAAPAFTGNGSIAGSFTIGGATGAALFEARGVSGGQWPTVRFMQPDGARRFEFKGQTEGTGDLVIDRFNSSGAYVDTPFRVSATDGAVTLNGQAVGAPIAGAGISVTGSTVSIGTNNALGVGAYAIMRNLSGGAVNSGSTTAGSNIRPVFWNGSAFTDGTAPSGTWRNISGANIPNTGWGLWVRSA